jgi:hypothetical protein
VADDFAKPKRGGVSVVFELRTAGRPRIKSLSAHKREEELLLHPFSALRVDAVEGGVVKLTEVVVAQLANLPQMVTNYMLPTMVRGMRPVDSAAEITQLKARIEELSTRLSEADQLRSQNSTLLTRNSALLAENSTLKSQVAEIPSLKSEVARLTAEVWRLQAQSNPPLAPVGPLAMPAPASVDQILPDSVAMAFSPVLKEWLGAMAPLQLLFKSSDARDVKGFHRACDGKANTLVVVRSKEGNIFGGFAVPAWDSSTDGWKDDPTQLSFIFVLKNTFSDPPTRFPMKSTKSAISCIWTSGPSFGGGCDFTVWDGQETQAWVDNSYVDGLGRGTAAFVSTGKYRQRFEVDSYEVWAAAGPPTPCA